MHLASTQINKGNFILFEKGKNLHELRKVFMVLNHLLKKYYSSLSKARNTLVNLYCSFEVCAQFIRLYSGSYLNFTKSFSFISNRTWITLTWYGGTNMWISWKHYKAWKITKTKYFDVNNYFFPISSKIESNKNKLV